MSPRLGGMSTPGPNFPLYGQPDSQLRHIDTTSGRQRTPRNASVILALLGVVAFAVVYAPESYELTWPAHFVAVKVVGLVVQTLLFAGGFLLTGAPARTRYVGVALLITGQLITVLTILPIPAAWSWESLGIGLLTPREVAVSLTLALILAGWAYAAGCGAIVLLVTGVVGFLCRLVVPPAAMMLGWIAIMEDLPFNIWMGFTGLVVLIGGGTVLAATLVARILSARTGPQFTRTGGAGSPRGPRAVR